MKNKTRDFVLYLRQTPKAGWQKAGRYKTFAAAAQQGYRDGGPRCFFVEPLNEKTKHSDLQWAPDAAALLETL